MYIYLYLRVYIVLNANHGPYATKRAFDHDNTENFALSIRVSRFLNLLDCTTDDGDDDNGDEDDRVSGRPYHCSAAINTQQWTGTNKLRAFPDVDARSLATVYLPPLPANL